MLWTPGQTLKTRPYRIDTILGQGGFGLTYKATHLQLNHQVVIKTPNPGLQNDPEYPNFVRRFIKEGQTIAKLSQNAHPGIVRVSDLFEERRIHCLVMELVVGQSLWDTVQQRGRLPDTEAVAIIRQIGEALIDVHQAGIVHRDAHPGNIMLRHNGQAVLIDFGIACELVPRLATSKHFAHRDFAPWEQQMEGSGEPTVDIYALAASLYYAVTGQTPTPSFKRQFQNAALKPAKDFGVKDWVHLAIEKGMASAPQKRPQSMKDWLNYLREPIPQTTPNVPPVELKSARGVDYSNLQKLLAAEKWKEADQETRKVMLKAAGQEKKRYFSGESIDNFPCDDLHTIDQLWIKYSNGHFGFSVQKKIWLEMGNKFNLETEHKLGDRVGWRKGDRWLDYYSDLTFNKQAPQGHLPSLYSFWKEEGVIVGGEWHEVGGVAFFAEDLQWSCELRFFFARMESCNLLPQTSPQVPPPPPDSLKSAQGVDYTHLRDLLAAGKWKEADEETLKVMWKAARREKERYFSRESIKNFPCDDLRTIDQLWVKYSQGHFGFSVQKKIWLEVGGKDDYDTECKLGDRIGWRKGGSWLNTSDLTYNKQAPVGHLPRLVWVVGVGWVGGLVLGVGLVFLLSHQEL